MSKQIKLALEGLTSSGKSHEAFGIVNLINSLGDIDTIKGFKPLGEIITLFKKSEIKATLTTSTELADVYAGIITLGDGEKLELYIFDIPGEAFDDEKMKICMAIIDSIENKDAQGMIDIKNGNRDEVRQLVLDNWEELELPKMLKAVSDAKTTFANDAYKYLYPSYYIRNEATDIIFCCRINDEFNNERKNKTGNLFKQTKVLISKKHERGNSISTLTNRLLNAASLSKKDKKCRLSIRAIDMLLNPRFKNVLKTFYKAHKENAIQDLCSIISLCILAKVFEQDNIEIKPEWVTDVDVAKNPEYGDLIKRAIMSFKKSIQLTDEQKKIIKYVIGKFKESGLSGDCDLGNTCALSVPFGTYFSSSCIDMDGEIHKPDNLDFDQLQMPFGTLALVNDLFDGKMPLLENRTSPVKTGMYYNIISDSDS